MDAVADLHSVSCRAPRSSIFIDGQDVSGPLNACMAPAGSLRGVTGSILACRGLSGRMLAGFFGTGAHTLAVSVTLSDGRSISDSATWTIVP